MVLWPTTIESLAKYEAGLLAVVVFAFNLRQSSIKRKSDYNAALTSWANGAIDQLLTLKFENPAETLLKLRVTIDQGRLFFPNRSRKDSLYGSRPRLLDWLVYSEKLMGISEISLGEEAEIQRNDLLEKLRRRFIEDAQLILAPTSFFQMAPILRLQLMVWQGSGAMDTSQKKEPIPQAKTFLEQHYSK